MSGSFIHSVQMTNICTSVTLGIQENERGNGIILVSANTTAVRLHYIIDDSTK